MIRSINIFFKEKKVLKMVFFVELNFKNVKNVDNVIVVVCYSKMIVPQELNILQVMLQC